MGRDFRPKYRIEWRLDYPVRWTPMAWDTQFYGRANAKNLAKVAAKYAESVAPGGANYDAGRPQIIRNATLINQETNEVVASYAL